MRGVLQVLLLLPLAVSAAVEFVPPDFTVQKFTSSDQVLQNGTVYCVTENLELAGTNAVAAGGTGGSALSVASGATVYLHIAEGVTLTCLGGDGAPGTAGGANAMPEFETGTCTVGAVTVTNFDFRIPPGGTAGIGGGGGGAGILVPAGSTLVVFGRGRLKAVGGAGGRAGDGGDAASGGLYAMTAWCTLEGGLDYAYGPSNYVSNTGVSQSWRMEGEPTEAENCSSISGQPSSGGGGGGGAGGGGAAIGQSGQSGTAGTKGAESALMWVYSTAPGEGRTNRLASVRAPLASEPEEGAAAGSVRFGKELGLTLTPGSGGSGGSPGSIRDPKSPEATIFWDPLTVAPPPAPYHTQRLYMAEGQCGGAGGAGGAGAATGRGGRGGQGGAGGDSGSLVCKLTPGRPDTPFADGPIEPLSGIGTNGTAGDSVTDDTCQTNAVSIFQVADSLGHTAAIGINPFGSFYEARLGDGTVGQKNAKLTEQGVNTLLLWQNYLLGLWQDTAQRFWADVPQGTDYASATVFAKVGAQRPDPAKTGIGVAFRLDAKLRGATAETPGEPYADPVLPLALGAADPTGTYRVKAVFTNTTGFISLAPATNLIGVLRKGAVASVERRRDCMSVPWAGISADNGRPVTVSNIVRTAQLDPGDKLYSYDMNSGRYNVWKLGANCCWEPLLTIIAADETPWMFASQPAETAQIARGAAFWIERGVSKSLDLIGGIDGQAPSVHITAGTPEQPKWHLVSAPGYDAFGINAINENVKSEDRIILPTGGEPLVFMFADGKWSHSEYIVDDQGFVTVVRKDDKTDIPAGSGFWYVSEGGNPMIKFPEVKLK